MAGPVTGNLTIARTDLDSAFVQGATSEQFIAEILYPPFEVPNVSGSLGQTPVDQLFNDAADERAPDGSYNRITGKLSEDSYATRERGLEEAIDDRKAQVYANFWDFERDTALKLHRMTRRRLELDVRDSMHDASVFTGAANTLAVGNAWSDAANATPINDIATGKQKVFEKCGIEPDTLQISLKKLWDLSRTTQVLERLKYTGRPGGVLPTDVLADALGVRRIVVGNAVRNTADQGQTASLSGIWSDTAAMLLVTPSSSAIMEPCLGRILFYRETPGTDGSFIYTEEYREERVRGSVIRVRSERQVKRWSTLFGFRFTAI